MKNLGKSFYTRYKDYLPALGAIIALGVISTILIDGFMNVNSIGAILLRSSVLAMVAMGVTFVVIAGDSGLDLSTGALMVVGAMIGPNLRVGGEESLILSFLLVFVVGAAIGCINGLGVYFLKIPALVMTMAMNGLVAGYCIMLTHSQLTVNIPKSLADLNTVAFGPIRKMTLLIIILMILLQLFLTKSKFGQMLLLTGNNRQAARLNGIPVALVAIGSYAISGAMAACGGVPGNELSVGEPLTLRLPGGDRLVTADPFGEVTVWDPQTGTPGFGNGGGSVITGVGSENALALRAWVRSSRILWA